MECMFNYFYQCLGTETDPLRGCCQSASLIPRTD